MSTKYRLVNGEVEIRTLSHLILVVRKNEGNFLQLSLENIYKAISDNNEINESVEALASAKIELIGRLKNLYDSHDETRATALSMLLLPNADIPQESLYELINSAIISNDANNIIPFGQMLWLLIQAIASHENITDKFLYRGSRENLSNKYSPSEILSWHQFATCTRSASILNSPQLLGKCAHRTIFEIELPVSGSRAKDLTAFNPTGEESIVYPPTAVFEVISVVSAGSRTIINLKELEYHSDAFDFVGEDDVMPFNEPEAIDERPDVSINDVYASTDDDTKHKLSSTVSSASSGPAADLVVKRPSFHLEDTVQGRGGDTDEHPGVSVVDLEAGSVNNEDGDDRNEHNSVADVVPVPRENDNGNVAREVPLARVTTSESKKQRQWKLLALRALLLAICCAVLIVLLYILLTIVNNNGSKSSTVNILLPSPGQTADSASPSYMPSTSVTGLPQLYSTSQPQPRSASPISPSDRPLLPTSSPSTALPINSVDPQTTAMCAFAAQIVSVPQGLVGWTCDSSGLPVGGSVCIGYVSYWDNVVCDSQGHVTVIGTGTTPISFLSGTIPSQIGFLSSLQSFVVSNGLNGTIPSSIGAASSLQRLDLSKNRFTGTLPTTLGSLLQLTVLRLSSNSFFGPIPSSLGFLCALKEMRLNGNKLTASVPNTFGHLTAVQHLDLSGNKLIGSLPTKFGLITSLTALDVHSNGFTGPFPATATTLLSLQYVDVSSNSLSGTIPPFLCAFPIATFLGASNNCLYAPCLFYIARNDVPFDKLSQYPPDLILCQWAAVSPFLRNYYGWSTCVSRSNYCNWNGVSCSYYGGPVVSISINFNYYWYYSGSGNFVSIPAVLGYLTSLTYLSLTQSGFTGTIPSSIGYLTKLTYLSFSQSALAGKVPSSIGRMSSLVHLYLQGTKVTGTLPSSLGQLTNLADLYTDTTALTGSIPTSMCKLSALTYISMLVSSGVSSPTCIPGCLSTSIPNKYGTNVMTCTQYMTTQGWYNYYTPKNGYWVSAYCSSPPCCWYYQWVYTYSGPPVCSSN